MVGWVLVALGVAWAKSPCAELKPKRPLDPAAVTLASGVLKQALSGVPVASGALAALPTPGAQPPPAADAREWLLYETCQLKEAGLLSAEKAEEIVAAVLLGEGGSAAAGAAPTAGGAGSVSAVGTLSPTQQMMLEQRNQYARDYAYYCTNPPVEGACATYRKTLAAWDASLKAQGVIR